MTDATISNPVRSCLQVLERLLAPESSKSDESNEAIFAALREEEARFKVWAGNIGAHKTGRSSLEYRLRDASHIRKQVIELLADLIGLIEDASAIVAGEKTPWDELEDVDEDGVFDDTASARGSNKDNAFPETELGQIATDVTDVINCLLRLSVAIRNPAPHDRFAASIPTADTYHYEPYDIQHVKAKFGQVEDMLAKRLGKAISRRRQYFKYRQSHHQKLCDGLQVEHDLPKDTVSTVASSIPEGTKEPSFNPTLAAMDEDAISDSGASHTSFASSIAESETLKVPPLPREAEKGPFECPFCFMIITASSTISWRRHVFGDLRPYICLWPECTQTEREFSRRHEWTSHELQNHWKRYVCPGGCDKTFRSASQCKEHLGKFHRNAIPPNQLDAMISLSARPMDVTDGMSCPLCQEPLASLKQYQRHVGRHQEQLALFALPAIDSEDVEEDKDGHDNTSRSDHGDSTSEAVGVSEDEGKDKEE
ncbi:hypothetical protein B0H66DRAFT_255789 [Apodospora peruviana]|uniref:C2H2-type domain-containing protein n=1 Tax=Apodospora peruviana TaxID=516989 RepID=A0AAE0M4L5_9PEZI|nr:hypothetical protein B0H66DRAFT_255789 [Apodospora peruviana]